MIHSCKCHIHAIVWHDSIDLSMRVIAVVINQNWSLEREKKGYANANIARAFLSVAIRVIAPVMLNAFIISNTKAIQSQTYKYDFFH